MEKKTKTRCLLITSIFPPIHGGSAVVYENLCKYAPQDSMFVLTPWRNYATGNVIEGWQNFDKQAPYYIERMELLRPYSIQSKSRLHSLWLLATQDLPLKLKTLLKVISIVRSKKINIICVGELNSGSWLGFICQKLFGCKMINYIHGEEITTTTPYLLYGRGKKFYLKQANAVIAVSEFTRNALIKMMEVPVEKIKVITNGVDTNKFFPGKKDKKIIRKHNLKDKSVILTVGRLIERKGFDNTIRALPEIIKSIPSINYLIVGDGEYRQRLESLVTELELHSYVTFAGRIAEEDLVKYYQTCDLFVMPNRELSDHDTEGFGLVFLEANACQKAVVGGRAGGAIEAVKHEQTGLLVDGYNVAEIGDAIVKLLKNHEYRQKMEIQGLETAQNANWEKQTASFFELCQQLIQENSK
jgi:phosphatidylinositol alpha-1,6-mannosyltransferase